tara:strand:- start:723 stop:872 length:150 start_codon:yes stop_codon:yes gene_type:complete
MGFSEKKKEILTCPFIITIVLMGSLIIFTQGSVIAPFYIFNILRSKENE